SDLAWMWLVAPPTEPTRCVEMESLARQRGALGELLGQRRQQLELGRTEHGTEAELAHRPGDAGGEQRLGLLCGQPGQSGAVPVDELAPPVGPRLRVDGHARRAQRLEV